MIIKEVTIENYLCYYGVNKFKLANGLNIFLGENGEGKTKFFEALKWLFSYDNEDLHLLVSKKNLNEKVANESFRVRVEILVDHHNEIKTLSKEFSVNKIDDIEYNVGKAVLKGKEEFSNGERSPVDGKYLLEYLFPSEIRRYSMFKGENELNIFDNEDALINLINLFSNARHYEKYESRGIYLKDKSEEAVDKVSRLNNKNEREYKRIENNIEYLNRLKKDELIFLQETDKSLDKTKKNIQDAEKYINNAEALETINSRIDNIESEISRNERLIQENYTIALFDENWILINFDSIHDEFSQKVSELSKEKRKLQSDFDRKIGIKEGERKAKYEIIKDLIPLPQNVPSSSIMKEMIKEKVCKVCNRPAEEGSEALEFMKKRLQNFEDSQNGTVDEEEGSKELFHHDYTNKLLNLSSSLEDDLSRVKNISKEIQEAFDFNQARKTELVNLREKLEKELQERNRIISNSSVGSESLSVILKDYNTWQDDIKKLNEKHNDYQSKINDHNSKLTELKNQKEKIDLTNANSFLINTRNILRDIDKIFRDTKERKFEEFIQLLSKRSNQIFTKMNIDAFTGVIDFKLLKNYNKVNVDIQLKEKDGSIFYSPNQSLITSMHISILLAIAELSKEINNDTFPMLFDAPTSSFGENKMTEFLNLIQKTDNQTIILIKDYIAKDENRNLYIKSEFDKVKRDKAFWIKLKRPFDEKDLRTIETQKIDI